MAEGRLSEEDITRTLEIADGYLEEAENVLWNSSKEVDSAEVATALDDLTHDVWDLQHKIRDLQRELD
jgi:hypothetical protein